MVDKPYRSDFRMLNTLVSVENFAWCSRLNDKAAQLFKYPLHYFTSGKYLACLLSAGLW